MRVNLKVLSTLDLESVDKGIPLTIYRCLARLKFRNWTQEHTAILDTGAPFSVIPAPLWKKLDTIPLFPTGLKGIIPGKSAVLPAKLAQINCILNDEGPHSPQLTLTAMLVESESVPLILGWAGCLDRAKLVLDKPQNLAYLEF